MIHRRTMLGLLAASPLVAAPALAAPERIYVSNGFAIGGYDAVAYFVKKTATIGSRDYMLMWRGAIWRFESAVNQAMFERNPMAFAPRYGGYCAFSLSQGVLSPTDPDAWAIYDDQLFLTHSTGALQTWTEDPEAHMGQAERHWPGILYANG